VEWIPPPHLDTGQARVNDYHHPERLRPPEDELFEDPVFDDPMVEGAPLQCFDDEWLDGPPDYEPTDDDSNDYPHEPGGPEPNAA
jgi:hypothetical protein